MQRVMVNARGTGGGLVALDELSQSNPANGPRNRRAAAGSAPAGPRLYGGSELTEAGEKAAADFKREDNPRFHCETTSIVFDWTFDGPVNRITQNKDSIVIEYGQFGLKRTIYMNLKEHPAAVKPSRAGHSIGHWEGDTLVVDTVGFLPGFLNTPVRNSDKLHVVERFSLDPDKDGADAQLFRGRSRVLERQIHGLGYGPGCRRPVQSGQMPGAELHRLLEAAAALKV